MKLLITGGAGFIGSRLARTLLAQGQLGGQTLDEVVLADQFPAPADLAQHPKVRVQTGPLLSQCADFAKAGFGGVFHLASAVSGECEADFDLGLRSNLDSTRALLEAMRQSGQIPRFVFSSSVAVYGPDDAHPMPAVVDDNTLPCPQTSYGVQKLICEHLVSDYTRKGFIDGRSARLMTVSVRPGKPNGAASSFFSGIIREPLSGVATECPVDPSVSHPVSSPGKTVEGLMRVFQADRRAYNGRTAMNLAGINITVADMLQALEEVAGPKVRALVTFKRNETIARIVDNWPKGANSPRATALGLEPDASYADIIRQYIADCHANGTAKTALKALN